MSITILGASRGPGRLLFDQLAGEGQAVVGIARNRDDIAECNAASFISLDGLDAAGLQRHIAPGTTLVHCAPPEILTGLLALEPDLARLVALGSTRLFSRFPDDKQRRVAAMAEAIAGSSIPATLLHPTLIYGAPGLNNIERILRVARVSPWLPLPAQGRSLIQPVFARDVVAAIRTSLAQDETIGTTLVIAGPDAVSYREFVETCIAVAGLSCRVVSMPYAILRFLAPVTRLIPGLPGITAGEIERLLEDKNFPTDEAGRLLDMAFTPLQAGLAQAINPRIQT